MIHLRKNPFSETQIEITFNSGETAKDLVDRALSSNGYELSDNVLSHFHILVNGHTIERDMWPFTNISETDLILIAPRIARGEGGQLFKQIAIIAIAVVASVFVSPALGGGLYGALGAAAVTIAGTLAVNALIPPPGLPGVGGIGGTGSSFEGSQMYTITSQSNNAKKFGSVPKVYGTHRMFPIIAANPYTEIEADPVTGTLVQYYYAIYDFGFGPLEISDIKIGDTPISAYADSKYRMVDLNKPAVDEGPWDSQLHSTFEFYKGDTERDGTQVALDKNQGQSGAQLFEYQTVRNASAKVSGNNQEITLDFVCPQGLQAYSTNGNKSVRNIDLLIEFSKVGEDIWRPYNDLNYVKDFTVAGGVTVFSDKQATVGPIQANGSGSDMTLIKVTKEIAWFWEYTNNGGDASIFEGGLANTIYLDTDNNPATPPIKLIKARYYSWGYPKGTTKIALNNGLVGLGNGDALYFKGNKLGVVVNITAAPWPGYSYYHLDSPLAVSYVVFETRTRIVESQSYNEITKIYTYAQFEYDYKFISSSSLTDKVYVKKISLGTARIAANTANPHYSTIQFSPKQKVQYKIRVTRIASFSDYTYQILDKLTLVNLSTRFDRDPIITDKRHLFLEVKIRATNQLNGSVNNLSAIAESILDVYDPDTETWVKQKTDNPAWVFCDLMTGELNKRALSKSRLHTPSILEWAEFCEEIPEPPPTQSFVRERFTCNFVLDFDTTLQSIISTVCNSAQASLNIVDGKYGVLIDKLKTVPVQVFTPRNSTNFSSQRSYDTSPHAIRIRYIDPFKNWEVNEVTVYDNGYNELTAVTFDEMSTFACTNQEQAWRFGRYMLAQARLRKERIAINVDFEHIVCTRGDYVQITQDVMRAGGRPARVKEVDGNLVTIDDGIDTLAELEYGYVYRNPSEGIKTSTLTVINSSQFELDGDIPEEGDLIIIGEVGKIVFDCIVKAISPGSDLTATLELVEKADDIYLAESSDTIPPYDPKLTVNVDSEAAAPPAVDNLEVISNTWRVKGGAYEYYVGIDWDIPIGAAFEKFEIYVDSGQGYDLVDFTNKSFYEYIVDPDDLGILHSFKVLAVSSTGKKISLIEAPFVTATPEMKVDPPSDIEFLHINITGEVMQLDWPDVEDSDLAEYLIRYSPRTDGTWEASIPLLRVDKNTTLTSYQARTGTYLIKAVDLNRNESNLAALAITTIPELFDLNVIDETNDFPDLEGELVTTETDGEGLVLKRLFSGGVETNNYYSEGYYYYKNFLDLGEIYTVRLQSLIEAEGFTVGDLMSNWPDLASLTSMSLAGGSEWDVETQYRATDNFNVMSEWSSLSDVNPLSEGDIDQWTPWRKFIMSDVTGRIFQYRLKLISNVPHVTPRVYEGKIKADMPDRDESWNNLVSSLSGTQVNYTPEFKGPGTSPNVQITVDDGETGDYWVIENKTLAGFKITFYDENNIAVVRQFDVAVSGYGRKATAVI